MNLTSNSMTGITRRRFLQSGAVTFAAGSQLTLAGFAPAKKPKPQQKTKFQIACMTLPYSRFPLHRALTGIKAAGYKFVAWGTRHQESGGRTPVMPTDAPPRKAKELGRRCRDIGLEPVMMFSTVYPEAKNGLKILTQRIKQAAAAKIGQVLTFGHTKGGNRKLWIERFKKLGPIARENGVMIVVKQHGGSTGTGAACAKIVREVDDAGIRVNYDAGNVMDYLNVDPIPDIRKCADVVHSFCIKDHRNFPQDQDCGPGLGVIDHYRLLHPVAFTGRTMPLCCENIFAPVVPRPTKPEGVDTLARRAREFLETVIRGLHASHANSHK
ncbi:MAG: sugar phosphate isomerase/epimerase [Planctomycetes bacterium]|nr:sugar phosphate isomerase/epimerase [Planctomycetota bacterium]